MGKREQFTAQQMINALIESQGFLTHAAHLLGCHYKTVERYVNVYPSVKEAVKEAREKRGDTLELTALKKAIAGDTALLIFMLKTQFHERGFTERLRIEGNLKLEVVNQLVAVLIEKGFDPAETFEQMIKRLQTVDNGDPKLPAG
jgi:hypothetical protein